MSDAPRIRTWAMAMRHCLDEVATAEHPRAQNIDSKYRWPIDGKRTWLEVLVELNIVAAVNGSGAALDRILSYTEQKPAQVFEPAAAAPLFEFLRQMADEDKRDEDRGLLQ